MKYLILLVCLTACGDSVTWAPDAVRWPMIPLRVSLDADAASYSASLDGAISFWESSTGLDLFVRVDGPADVTVGIGSARGSLVGTCQHFYPGAHHARVELLGPGDQVGARWVLAHELGHALGLGHDDRKPGSIMFPDLDVGLMAEGESIPVFSVTSGDRDALRKAYP